MEKYVEGTQLKMPPGRCPHVLALRACECSLLWRRGGRKCGEVFIDVITALKMEDYPGVEVGLKYNYTSF